MLRLAPYPFNVMSALLGQVRVVSARTHALATALSLCKIVLHTWTGSLLEELSQVITGPGHDDDDGGWTTARVSELCALVVAIGLAVASGIYVYRVVQRALAECREDKEEEEEVAIEVPVMNTV